MLGRRRLHSTDARGTSFFATFLVLLGLAVAATVGVGSTQAGPGGLQARPLDAPRAVAPRIPSQLAAAGAVEVIAVLAEGADTSGLSAAAAEVGAKLERGQDAAAGGVPFAVFSSTTLNRDQLIAGIAGLPDVTVAMLS